MALLVANRDRVPLLCVVADGDDPVWACLGRRLRLIYSPRGEHRPPPRLRGYRLPLQPRDGGLQPARVSAVVPDSAGAGVCPRGAELPGHEGGRDRLPDAGSALVCRGVPAGVVALAAGNAG